MLLIGLVIGLYTSTNEGLLNAIQNNYTVITLKNLLYTLTLTKTISHLRLVGPADIKMTVNLTIINELVLDNVNIVKDSVVLMNGQPNSKISIRSSIVESIFTINMIESLLEITSQVWQSKLKITLKSSGLNVTNSHWRSITSDGAILECHSSSIWISQLILQGNKASFMDANECFITGKDIEIKQSDNDMGFGVVALSTIEMTRLIANENRGGKIGLLQMVQSSGFIHSSKLSNTSGSLVSILHLIQSDLELKNTVISNHTMTSRLFQIVQQSHLVVVDSIIKDNSKGWLFGVFSDSGLVITGSSIRNNQLTTLTPIFISSSSTLDVTSTSLIENDYGAYFITMDYGTTMRIQDSIITRNVGSSFIRFIGTLMSITSSVFEKNKIAMNSKALVLIDGIEKAKVIILNSTFTNLDLGTNAIALQTNSLSIMTISTSHFTNIKGPLFISKGALSIQNSKFENISTTSAIQSMDSLVITESNFKNISGINGAVVNAESNLFITNNTFEDISSTGNGGVINSLSYDSFNVSGNIFNHTDAAYGSVFYTTKDMSKSLPLNKYMDNTGYVAASPPTYILNNASSLSVIAGQPIYLKLSLVDIYHQHFTLKDPNQILIASINMFNATIIGPSSVSIFNDPIEWTGTLSAPFGNHNLTIASIRDNYALNLIIPVTVLPCTFPLVNIPTTMDPNPFCRIPICSEGCHATQGMCINDNTCQCQSGFDGIDCSLMKEYYDTVTITSNGNNCTKNSLINSTRQQLEQLGNYKLIYRSHINCSLTFSVMKDNDYVEGEELLFIQKRLNGSIFTESYKSQVELTLVTIIILVLVVILSILLLFIALFLFIYRKTPIMTSSFYLFNTFVVFGSLLLLISIILQMKYACILSLWTISLGFIFIFGCFCLKQRRIVQLFNHIKLTNVHLTSQLLLMVLLVAIVSMIYTILFPPKAALTPNAFSGRSLTCNGNIVINSILYILGGLLLIASCCYSLLLRNSQGIFKESYFLIYVVKV